MHSLQAEFQAPGRGVSEVRRVASGLSFCMVHLGWVFCVWLQILKLEVWKNGSEFGITCRSMDPC